MKCVIGSGAVTLKTLVKLVVLFGPAAAIGLFGVDFLLNAIKLDLGAHVSPAGLGHANGKRDSGGTVEILIFGDQTGLEGFPFFGIFTGLEDEFGAAAMFSGVLTGSGLTFGSTRSGKVARCGDRMYGG